MLVYSKAYDIITAFFGKFMPSGNVLGSHTRPTALPKRIILKLSGELFSSSSSQTLSFEPLERLTKMLGELIHQGFSLGIIIGGGNILRGRELQKECKFSRTTSDLIGMYATIINGLALREALLQRNIPSVCFAPPGLIGTRIGDKNASLLSHDISVAQSFFSTGTVTILAGGTGNPFFTTDTAAVLRALELGADIVIKATKVNGIYSHDPMTIQDAKRYESITFKEAIEKKLQVMDQSALSLAQEHKLPLFVYKYGEPDSMIEAMRNTEFGTFVLP